MLNARCGRNGALLRFVPRRHRWSFDFGDDGIVGRCARFVRVREIKQNKTKKEREQEREKKIEGSAR